MTSDSAIMIRQIDNAVIIDRAGLWIVIPFIASIIIQNTVRKTDKIRDANTLPAMTSPRSTIESRTSNVFVSISSHIESIKNAEEIIAVVTASRGISITYINLK